MDTDKYRYVWTDGSNEIFQHFYLVTENYYSSVVGGEEKRRSFIPYNLSSGIEEVLLVFLGDTPVACSGLKRYSEYDVEIKRVWVEPEHRGKHIATQMIRMLEQKAVQLGYRRMILQTREIMTDAVGLYLNIGYNKTDNYPPYDKLDGAVCFAKEL